MSPRVVCPLLVTSLVALATPACVEEEPALETTAVALTGPDEVDSPPRPTAGPRVAAVIVGQPFELVTSFHGTCQDPIGGDYTCLQQTYDLEVECVDAPCEVTGADVATDVAVTTVRPLAPGPLRLRARLTDHALGGVHELMSTVDVRAPERIIIDCRAGEPSRPCRERYNPHPLWLTFSLGAGDLVYPAPDGYVVTSSLPGVTSGRVWGTGASGELSLTVAYDGVVADLALHLAPVRDPGLATTVLPSAQGDDAEPAAAAR